MKKNTPWYNKIEMAIIIVLFSLMTLITFVSIISRYCFGFTFSWAEQLTRVMFVWITFAGISLAGMRGAHMRVSAITLVVGEKRGKYVFWLGDVISILFSLFIAYRMKIVVANTIHNHQVFTAMPWMPVWVMYIAGVLGMLGFAVRTLGRMIGEIRAEKNKKLEGGKQSCSEC